MIFLQPINLICKACIWEEQVRTVLIFFLVFYQTPVDIVMYPFQVKLLWTIINNFLNYFPHFRDDFAGPIGWYIGELDTKGRLTVLIAVNEKLLVMNCR